MRASLGPATGGPTSRLTPVRLAIAVLSLSQDRAGATRSLRRDARATLVRQTNGPFVLALGLAAVADGVRPLDRSRPA